MNSIKGHSQPRHIVVVEDRCAAIVSPVQVLYATACCGTKPQGDGSFLPLSVHYQERFSAAGRTRYRAYIAVHNSQALGSAVVADRLSSVWEVHQVHQVQQQQQVY